MAHAPGTVFNYSGGDTNLLGQVLREVTGKTVAEYADEVFFAPLGIEAVTWETFDNGLECVSGSMHLTPRQMAKLGFVFINGGFWNNNSVVSPEWIERATQTHIRTGYSETGVQGYGFQWWTTTFRAGNHSIDSFIARGWGGQRIIGMPELNMVTVFTGADYSYEYSVAPEMLMTYILDAAL